MLLCVLNPRVCHKTSNRLLQQHHETRRTLCTLASPRRRRVVLQQEHAFELPQLQFEGINARIGVAARHKLIPTRSSFGRIRC
jgi:hypothetical protein